MLLLLLLLRKAGATQSWRNAKLAQRNAVAFRVSGTEFYLRSFPKDGMAFCSATYKAFAVAFRKESSYVTLQVSESYPSDQEKKKFSFNIMSG
ncbi:hypothetical protein [Okeania sp. KiyG1]|uniref:hypothetical protein n=1 Tax=Okeania sp. KiyG1 TaxID=2720165 RepID=UPI0019223058|nr:hypothetical protein [Okeania sp. KiyG1]